MQHDAQRLQQRSVGVVQRVGQLVQVSGGVDMVSSDRARVGRDAGEGYGEAEVVVSGGAFEAAATGEAGLDGDAVAGSEVANVRTSPNDFASGFMA